MLVANLDKSVIVDFVYFVNELETVIPKYNLLIRQHTLLSPDV